MELNRSVSTIRIVKLIALNGLLLSALCCLMGCGQTGPLYLPEECSPETTVNETVICEKCPKF